MGVICSKQLKVYCPWKLASDFAVGESVFLMENGSPVEYLVVNQGIPSDLYDSTCNGTWLLRKNIYTTYQWSGSNANNPIAGIGHIYAHLESLILPLFDNATQSLIQTVKIPFHGITSISGSGGLHTGSDGLPVKIFPLAVGEVGAIPSSYSNCPADGACLQYFNGGSVSVRKAYLNGTAESWWLRTPNTGSTSSKKAYLVTDTGSLTSYAVNSTAGIRPALILPFNVKFNTKTLLPVGVS